MNAIPEKRVGKKSGKLTKHCVVSIRGNENGICHFKQALVAQGAKSSFLGLRLKRKVEGGKCVLFFECGAFLDESTAVIQIGPPCEGGFSLAMPPSFLIVCLSEGEKVAPETNIYGRPYDELYIARNFEELFTLDFDVTSSIISTLVNLCWKTGHEGKSRQRPALVEAQPEPASEEISCSADWSVDTEKKKERNFHPIPCRPMPRGSRGMGSFDFSQEAKKKIARSGERRITPFGDSGFSPLAVPPVQTLAVPPVQTLAVPPVQTLAVPPVQSLAAAEPLQGEIVLQISPYRSVRVNFAYSHYEKGAPQGERVKSFPLEKGGVMTISLAEVPPAPVVILK